MYTTLISDFDKTFVLVFYNSFLKIELNCDKENCGNFIYIRFPK